jgi:hypothetical protein
MYLFFIVVAFFWRYIWFGGFLGRVSLCYPALALSSWAQTILLPQPPQHCNWKSEYIISWLSFQNYGWYITLDCLTFIKAVYPWMESPDYSCWLVFSSVIETVLFFFSIDTVIERCVPLHPAFKLIFEHHIPHLKKFYTNRKLTYLE